MMARLFGGTISGTTAMMDDPEAPFTDNASSWDDLRKRLESMQTPEERAFRKEALFLSPFPSLKD